MRRAAKDTTLFVRDWPIPALFLFLIPATATGLTATLLPTEDWDTGWRIGLSLVAGVGGALAVLALVFLVKLVTAPRHQLEDRVTDLEERSDDQRDALASLTQEQRGERDQFVTTYIDLRAAIRHARTQVGGAIDSNVLWDRTVVFSSSTSEKKKTALASHPYAKADGIYSSCADAFEHVEKLDSIGVLRFRSSRRVQPSDNLDAVLVVLDTADENLTRAIDEAQPDQPR